MAIEKRCFHVPLSNISNDQVKITGKELLVPENPRAEIIQILGDEYDLIG